jgi:hypothetical protein
MNKLPCELPELSTTPDFQTGVSLKALTFFLL